MEQQLATAEQKLRLALDIERDVILGRLRKHSVDQRKTIDAASYSKIIRFSPPEGSKSGRDAAIENDFSERWKGHPIKARIESLHRNSAACLLQTWKQCIRMTLQTPSQIIGSSNGVQYAGRLVNNPDLMDPIWTERFADWFGMLIAHPLFKEDPSSIATCLGYTALCRRNERRVCLFQTASNDNFLSILAALFRANTDNSSAQDLRQRACRALSKCQSPYAKLLQRVEALTEQSGSMNVAVTGGTPVDPVDIALEDLHILRSALDSRFDYHTALTHVRILEAFDPVTPEDLPANVAQLESALIEYHRDEYKYRLQQDGVNARIFEEARDVEHSISTQSPTIAVAEDSTGKRPVGRPRIRSPKPKYEGPPRPVGRPPKSTPTGERIHPPKPKYEGPPRPVGRPPKSTPTGERIYPPKPKYEGPPRPVGRPAKRTRVSSNEERERPGIRGQANLVSQAPQADQSNNHMGEALEDVFEDENTINRQESGQT